jgi:2-methylcitrate dehydratase PrpD
MRRVTVAGVGDVRPEVTRLLATYISSHPRYEAPAVAQRHVSRALLDLVGVTVLGAHEPAGELVRAYAQSQGGHGPSAVLGGGMRLTPSMAALANGTAGHALDYDDIGLDVGHISVAIVPASLAMADQLNSTGADFIDAMTIGYEVAHRLTEMYEDKISGPYEFGYHKPSVYAVFGATAAVCRLLRMDVGQVQCALGIAASQAGGVRVNFGTMTKPFHAGLSNRTGVESALLARQGFTASEVALEGLYGWYDVICRKDGDLTKIVDTLGQRFAVEDGMIFKPYPCCGANHYAIDGVLQLMADERLSFDDVSKIEVTIQARYLEEVLVYPWPTSGLEGKFSLAYNVAAALVDGEVTVATFTDEHLATLAVARNRVKVTPKVDMPRDGATLWLHTKDGRQFRRDHFVLRGTLEKPFSWDDLTDKFEANTDGRLPKEHIAEIVQRILSLADQSQMRVLTELLLGQS